MQETTQTRRAFIGAAAAATMGLSVRSAAKPVPRLLIGGMSDDHLHPDRPETHRKTEACFKLFRREGVDVVVDTGDIADRSHVSELEYFRGLFDRAFAGTDCVPFFGIANHDYNYVPGTRGNDPKNIENAWRALKMSGANHSEIIKGYWFVNVYQNEPNPRTLDEAIAKAVKANVGNRPVFVVNHVPPAQTTAWTNCWSSVPVRKILDKYPQVVALTGHNHSSIKWAANVWQGNFTAINLGAHAQYSNPIEGEAMILEVFDDRIDVRRYEAVSGREIGADDRWSIPLPLDPQRGPYRFEPHRKRLAIRPALPESITVAYSLRDGGWRGELAFPSAKPRDISEFYRLKFEALDAAGSATLLATMNFKTPQVMDEPETEKFAFPSPVLNATGTHRVTITPIDSFGGEGVSRTATFAVPAGKLKEVAPGALKVARYTRSGYMRAGETFAPGADGWFDSGSGVTNIVFPKIVAETLEQRERIIVVVDIASDQPGTPKTFSIASIAPDGRKVGYDVGERIYTLPGSIASNRYAWILKKGKAFESGSEYALIIRDGGSGRFRVNGLSLFVRSQS